jgi:hypothetical protein
MKRFLIVILVVVVLIVAGGVGLGFNRGWFTLTVDKEKIQADKDTVVEKVDNFTHPAKTPAEKSKAPAMPQE